jgi:MFS transporter, DHA1 family, tetracycline resistance protein
MRSRQAGLAFIFVTLVLDVLGIGIVIPILPELIATFRDSDLSTAAPTDLAGARWTMGQRLRSTGHSPH